MKTKILLLSAAITAFTFNTFAQSGAAALLNSKPTSAPAVANATVTTIVYADTTASISPRAQANQSKIVKGTANDSNPSLACSKMMGGTPKNIAACTEHANMPVCNPVTVAPLK